MRREAEVTAPARRPVPRWETCGQAWLAALRHVWIAGEAGLSEHGPIIEGPPLLFEISSLSWGDPILRAHGRRPERLARGAWPGDAAWGDGRVRGLPGEPGAAGQPTGQAAGLDLLCGPGGADRLRWVVDLLRARPWTTNAWVPLTVPGEPVGPVGPAGPAGLLGPGCEQVGLVALSFRLRAYRLTMTAVFRAQDVFTGYQAYIPLRTVQFEVAGRLGLPAGPLRVIVDVPHLYVADTEHTAAVLSAPPEPHAAA